MGPDQIVQNAERDRQRRIGQQVMLFRLLVAENKKADLGIPSFIKTSDIALWMDEEEERIEEFISDYNTMSPYGASQRAAKIFCQDKKDVDIGYVFRTMYHYGPRYIRSILNNKPFDFEGFFQKNWSDFHAVREYQGSDRSVTDEKGFRSILVCYRDYYLNRMRSLEERGYDEDIPYLLTYGKNTDEENLVHLMEQTASDE